jgi:hypothetical protein
MLKPVFARALGKRTPVAFWFESLAVASRLLQRCCAERTSPVSSREFAFRPKEVHDREDAIATCEARALP